MYGAPSFIFVPLLSLFLFPVGTVRVRSWATLAAAAALAPFYGRRRRRVERNSPLNYFN